MRHAAICAGTFDPLTLGHMDLIERASRIFDRVVLAIVGRPRKTTMFSVEQRGAMAREAAGNIANVEVDSFDGLLVDYAQFRGIHVLVRGIRAFSDFEYEFQMALTNRELAPDIETVFLMTRDNYSFISSSTVREIIEYGRSVGDFVPEAVRAFIEKARAPKTSEAGGAPHRKT